MKIKLGFRRCLLALVMFSVAGAAQARDQIRIVGSATVYPFITAAAEQFGQEKKFKTPIVEATGTGGGFKLFCEGKGEKTPDINNASRRIADSEVKLCAENGVGKIIEIPIGYDGIVLAGKKGTPALALTSEQIFLALAREVPNAGGELVPNPAKMWSEVDKSLPEREIRVYGPPPTSGTRDTLAELVMEKACEKFAAFERRYPDLKERQKKCKLLREDGRYVEAGENYNIVVQKLFADEAALGIMGFGFYDENTSRVQATRINGVDAKAETIANGSYGLARTLYVYVKQSHAGLVPGMRQFVEEITSDGASGDDGYMTLMGLVPLNESDQAHVRQAKSSL